MNATVMAMLLIAVHVMICVLLCVLSRVGVLRVGGAASLHAVGAIVGAIMRADAAYAHADSRW
nr:hypothetical protein [Bifidobacterium sp.]